MEREKDEILKKKDSNKSINGFSQTFSLRNRWSEYNKLCVRRDLNTN